MLSQLTVSFDIAIRLCGQEDIAKLEWYGLYTRHREIFRQTFERHQQGTLRMLVAFTNDFPVGQVWVDLSKKRSESIGILYALRVFPCLQRKGIGSRLLEAAETVLKEQGYVIAEIGVEKTNDPARLLYKRCGYRRVDEQQEELIYLTPWGEEVHEVIDEWILHKQLQ